MIASTIVGTCLIVAITVAIGWYVEKKIGVKPEAMKAKSVKGNLQVDISRKPRVTADLAGESPALAIRAGASQMANLRSTQRCKDCRAALEADGPDEELRYADRPLLLLHFRCPACVRKRSLYVIPSG